MIDRVIWIVLDSAGIGAMPDAEGFGDTTDVNTICNISRASGGLSVPNMTRLGLGNIDGIVGLERTSEPMGCYARLAEKSKGKDTTVGHWEMVGCVTEKCFPVYPNGFPNTVMNEFKKATGRGVLCNHVASGTDVLRDYMRSI